MDHSLCNLIKLWAMLYKSTETGRSWWSDLTIHGPLEKGMANHFSILALRTPWTVWKGKKLWVIRSHHFMGNRWGNSGNSVRFYFGGSRITADDDCSHEIKRCLLLGRKVMTNLDSIFKSRDITLLTKVSLVKAMVFPVVMYGCESWTVKKAERWRIDAFEL